MTVTCSHCTVSVTNDRVWSIGGMILTGKTEVVCFARFHGYTALVGHGPLIIESTRSHSDSPHSVGLLWTIDQPNAETHNNQKRQPSNASGGIRTRNPRNRAAADPRLQRRGHWNGHKSQIPGVPRENLVPVSTKHGAWTAMGQNPGLHGERPATDHRLGT